MFPVKRSCSQEDPSESAAKRRRLDDNDPSAPAGTLLDDRLPTDLYFQIITNLSLLECGTLSLVSRKIHTQIWTDLSSRLLTLYFPDCKNVNRDKPLEALKEQHRITSNKIKGVCTLKTFKMTRETKHFNVDLSGQSLFFVDFDKKFCILDLKTMPSCLEALEWSDPYANFPQDTPFQWSCSVDTAGKRYFLTLSDGTIKICDFNANICATLDGHKARISGLCLKENRLISHSFDKTIKIWNLDTNTCMATVPLPLGIPCYVLDGQQLIVGLLNGIIERWDLNEAPNKEPRPTHSWKGHSRYIKSLYIDKQQQRLISDSHDGTLKFWDLNNIDTLIGSQDNTYSIKDFGRFVCSGQQCLLPHVRKYDDDILSKDANISILNLPLNEQNLLISVVPSSLFGFSTIMIRDFKVSDRDIFSEIADLFSSEEPDSFKEAMDRFDRMPPRAKNAIYAHIECGEDAFHNQNGMTSTPQQREQAIRNHLEEITKDT